MGEFIHGSGNGLNNNPNITDINDNITIYSAIFLFNERTDAENNIIDIDNNLIETYDDNSGWGTRYFTKDTTKIKGWPDKPQDLVLPSP
tara:strand:+ start:3049 stop:3315 length:267 start_codon:yes stop_codon:yes gene_type:complete